MGSIEVFKFFFHPEMNCPFIKCKPIFSPLQAISKALIDNCKQHSLEGIEPDLISYIALGSVDVKDMGHIYGVVPSHTLDFTCNNSVNMAGHL